MANTFRLNWFRKLINSCSGTRKYRHIDDSPPIASTSDLRSLNLSREVPRLPEEINLTATRPAKCHKRPSIAMTVRMNSVVRHLNGSSKQLRNVTLDPQKRARNEQLVKALKSRASGRPIPLEIFAQRRQKQTQQSNYQRIIGSEQNERDLVVTRNIEKMVREWQARLQSRRRGKKEPPTVEGRKSSGMPVKFTKNVNLKTGSLGLEHLTSQGKHINMDVRLARNSASSRSTDDPNHRNTQARPTYHMKIVNLKVKNIKDQRKSPNKDIKKVPINKSKSRTKSKSKSLTKSISKSTSISKSKSKPPNPSGSKLVKEEQKRLDILKEEWVQLKGLENACRLREAKPLTRPTGLEDMAPTDLDLASLIVDPKSFLTKVHVKSKFLSVDLGGNKLKSPLDTSKADSIGFGESDDGLPELGPD